MKKRPEITKLLTGENVVGLNSGKETQSGYESLFMGGGAFNGSILKPPIKFPEGGLSRSKNLSMNNQDSVTSTTSTDDREKYFTTLGDVLRNVFQSGGKKGEASVEHLLTGENVTELEPNKKVVSNAEIEDGEYVKFPDGVVQKGLGEKHKDGGIDMQIPDGTKIISNKRTLTKDQVKKLEEDYEIKVSTKNTYSEVIDKYVNKIGLTKLYAEQEEMFEELDDIIKNSQSEGSSRINKEYISKKIHEIEEKKGAKEKLKSELFDKVFTMQEIGKTAEKKKEVDQFFEEGGISRKAFNRVLDRYDISEEEGISLYNGTIPKSLLEGGEKRGYYREGGKKKYYVNGGEDPVTPPTERVVVGSEEHKALLEKERKRQEFLDRQEKFKKIYGETEGIPLSVEDLTTSDFFRTAGYDPSEIPSEATGVVSFPVGETSEESGRLRESLGQSYFDAATNRNYFFTTEDPGEVAPYETVIREELKTPFYRQGAGDVIEGESVGAKYIDPETKELLEFVPTEGFDFQGARFTDPTSRTFLEEQGVIGPIQRTQMLSKAERDAQKAEEKRLAEETANRGTAFFQEGGHKVKSRQGVRKNPDGSVSSHLMKREYIPGKGWVAFPSLFQNEKGEWIDLGEKYGDKWEPIYEYAKKSGEVYEFGENEESAINFADKGSWKIKHQDGGEHGDEPKTVQEAQEMYKKGLITREEADRYEVELAGISKPPKIKFSTTTGEHLFSDADVYRREAQHASEGAFGKITKENLPQVLNFLYQNFPDIVAEEYGVKYNDDGTIEFEDNLDFSKASDKVKHFQERAQERMKDTANLVLSNPDSFSPEYLESAKNYLDNETFDGSLARGVDSKLGQFTSGRFSLGIDVVTEEEKNMLSSNGIFTTKQLQDAIDSGNVELSEGSLNRLEKIRELTPEGTDPDFAIDTIGTVPSETSVEAKPEIETEEIDPLEGIRSDVTLPGKQYPRLFMTPDQTPIPPSAMEAHLLGNIRLERIDPLRIGIESELQQAGEAIKLGTEALNDLPPNQRASAIVRLQANVQKGINDAIHKANVVNAQNQASAELFNIGQAGREEQARVGNLLNFEQRQLTAKAKTEEEVRNYYDQLNRININNFRNQQDLNLIEGFTPDFSLGASGNTIEFTPEGEYQIKDRSKFKGLFG